MITTQEAAQLAAIRAQVAAGRSATVSAEHKQWVLDMVRREQVTVKTAVVQQARALGFDTAGIKTRKNARAWG